MKTRLLLAVVSASLVMTSVGLAQQPVKVEKVMVKATFTPAPVEKKADKKTDHIQLDMAYYLVPEGYFKDVGLGDETESKWVISPRELQLLEAANRANRELTKVKYLSGPRLSTPDGNMAKLEMGSTTIKTGIRCTPKLAANGIALDIEVFDSNTNTNVEIVVKTSETVPTSHSLVIRGPRMRMSDKSSDTMIIITPRRFSLEK